MAPRSGITDRTPGISAVDTVTSTHLWKSNQSLLFPEAVVIDSGARDFANSPGTKLEKGLAMGKLASGKYTNAMPESGGYDGYIAIGLLADTVSVADGSDAHGAIIRAYGVYSYSLMHVGADGANTSPAIVALAATQMLPGGVGKASLIPSSDQAPSGTA